MNINKIQAQLQRVPDHALIGYVKNPDGQVPSYLALAEITRRKEIRKAAAPQQAAPMQTVAQQAVAEVEPGIAQLPVRDDMFNEQAMAAGGIVSFADGGEPSLNLNKIPSLNIANRQPGVSLADQMAFTNTLSQARNPIFRAIGSSLRRNPNQGSWSKNMAEGGEVKRFAGPTGSFVLSGAENPLSLMGDSGDFLARINELKRSNPWMSETALIEKIKAESAPAPQMSAEEQKMYQGKPAPTPLNYDRPTTQQIMAMSQVPPLASTTVARPGAAGATGVGGVGGPGYQKVGYTDIPFDAAAYEKLKEAPVTAQQKMSEWDQLVGANSGLAGLKERLAGMETKAAKEAETAPWMALAKAGFSMAGGKSRNAISNIAEGAQAGLVDYVAAKDKLAAAEEKRFGIQSQLAQAERAEKIAAAKYGVDSAEHIKAQNRATDLAAIGAKSSIDVTNKSNRLKAEEANAKNALDAQQNAITAQHYADWKSVQQDANAKSVATMDKAEKQQQTALLSASLRDIDAQLKDPTLMLDKNRMAQLQKERAAVNARLYELTGVKPVVSAPAGGGTLSNPGKGGIRDYVPGGR